MTIETDNSSRAVADKPTSSSDIKCTLYMAVKIALCLFIHLLKLVNDELMENDAYSKLKLNRHFLLSDRFPKLTDRMRSVPLKNPSIPILCITISLLN